MNQKSSESPFANRADRAHSDARPTRRPVQFSLAKMLLILTVSTAAAAPLAYLARALRGSRHSHFVFILFCVAAPSLLLIIVSLTYRLARWLDRMRKP